MARLQTSQLKLALKILLGDFEVLQSHVRALVAEQFHDGDKADTRAQHLRSIGVSKLVRDNAGSNSSGCGDIPQSCPDSTNKHTTAAWAGQQQAARVRGVG